MKISRIEIKDFHQFQNFELDLTYPKGHEKAGQPLDKVCFIGQSGTGKTRLLNICRDILITTVNLVEVCKSGELSQYEKYKSNHYLDNIFFDICFYKGENNVKKQSLEVLAKQSIGESYRLLDSRIIDSVANQFLYFVFFDVLNQSNIVRSLIRKSSKVILREIDINGFWEFLIEKVKSHANEISKYRFAIAKAAENGDMELTEKKVVELKKWEGLTPNPLSDLAINFLDSILQEFGLKTKVDLDSLAEAEFINFIDRKGNTVSHNVWSTGTKQIVYKVLPLYILKPENAIILIDEPENSLYPNIQTKIIDHYLRLAPTCQFFVATHSPIIAASFEPWEIVELKFNEEGNVYREQYFEGENHVDNYFIDPRYYKYGTVLKEIFDLEQEGPDSDFRNKEMMRASRMEATIKRLNKEGKKEEAMKLYEEYKELARKLDWEVNI